MRAAAIQGVQHAGSRIHKNPRARNDLRILRCRQRHLDHFDAKQRRIRILVRRLARASGQLFALADKRSSRDIDVDVVLVIRIDDQRVRVRAAASLHGCHLLRISDVADIEDSHAAETIFLCGRRRCRLLFPGRWRWLGERVRGGGGGNPCVPQSSRPFGISTDMKSRFL